MSVNVTVRLSNAEAAAVLRSEGLTNGHGVFRSVALRSAELKLIGAIQQGLKRNIETTEEVAKA